MAIKTSKGKEGYYARYKTSGTYTKNRKARIERAIKLFPENEALKLALKDIVYRRKTPGANGWSHSGIATAKIFKEFCGNFDRDILSSNPKMASDALARLASNKASFKLPKEVLNSFSAKAPFSIAARVLG